MADKSKGMNKRVLSGMTDRAMPFRPRIMMHLHGKDAKRFMGSKPGTKISAEIRGVLQGVSLEEFNNNEPSADIRVTKITPNRRKKT